MGSRNTNDPFCGHLCFCWGHGTLVYDPCYHYDDDDHDALGGILVWSLTCHGTHEHALGMMVVFMIDPNDPYCCHLIEHFHIKRAYGVFKPTKFEEALILAWR